MRKVECYKVVCRSNTVASTLLLCCHSTCGSSCSHVTRDAQCDDNADTRRRRVETKVVSNVIAAVTKKRRKRRRGIRSRWVRSWICDRPRSGGYEALLKEIRVTDSKAYHNFCRMTPADETFHTNYEDVGDFRQSTKVVRTCTSTATCCSIVRHCR